jgi:DNA segregation ATPase FtsK/SpoIIIE, S-DNA-T family
LSYSNHYKNQVSEPGKTKKPKASKKGGKLKTPAFLDRLGDLFSDERTRNVLGVFLLMFSGILLLSFTSYLFTWKIDQDHVLGSSFGQIATHPDQEIENWLGPIGAYFGHLFIFRGFGVASFLFVLITFLLGFRVLFKINLLPFWKTVGYSLFLLIWLSLLFGAVFDNSFLLLGGSLGYYMNFWLGGVFGKIGAFTLISFSALVFAIINFNLSIPRIIQNLRKDPIVDAEESVEENKDADEHDEEDMNVNTGDSEEALEEKPLQDTHSIEFDDADDAKDASEGKPIESAADELSLDVVEVVSETEEEELEVVEQKEEETATETEATQTEETDLSLDVEEQIGDEPIPESEKIDPSEMVDYDPLLDLSKYQYPPIEMLADHGDGSIQVEREELELNKNRIVDTLKNYNIGISKIKATIGPTVTLYEIIPEAGVRISKIKNLEDDIALSLAALGIRIIAPIPGKGTIGIEVPNQTPDVVSMRTVIKSDKFQHSKMELPIALGKTISNETFVVDLAKMPHLLMAGATGQGKSVGLNAILASLLYKKHPAQVKFVLVDPKKVELTLFNKIERHFLAKLPDEEEAIITDTSKVVTTLNSLCIEMDDRYEMLKNAQCRNIKEYNAKFVKRKLNPNDGHKYLPYIVLVVDEFADLIMTAGKEVEMPIARLAQLARAIGIHLIIATQRPSVNIITGTIKANFPSRIAFRVTSKIDSRTILDTGGAEQLIGRGDMLYSNGNDLIRLQCAFVDTPEVELITDFIGDQQGYPDAHLLPEFVGEGGESGGESFAEMDHDVLFEDAARIVVLHQQGSASLLQRKLKLGYNRAGRIVDQLEAAGIIGPFEGSKARQVLIPDDLSLEQHLDNLGNKS